MLNRLAASIIVLLLAIAPASAVIGVPPTNGFALPDGAWLNGLANGENFSSITGLAAVGTTQATSLQLAPNYYGYEVDTATSAGTSGVALPFCTLGNLIWVSNNTAYTIYVYPAISNNPATAAQDVINVGSAATSTTITTYASKIFFCAKNGVWAVK